MTRTEVAAVHGDGRFGEWRYAQGDTMNQVPTVIDRTPVPARRLAPKQWSSAKVSFGLRP